jgi:hypothetical protein
MTGPMAVSSFAVSVTSSLKPSVITSDSLYVESNGKMVEKLRYCQACNDLLPIGLFSQNIKRKYTCINHIRAERRKGCYGTPARRAFNALRCRARQDMITFGLSHMAITRTQVLAMLSDEQVAQFSQCSLMPLRPDKPLASDNAVIVSTDERRFVMNTWRKQKDADAYERNIKAVLGM